MAGSGHRRLAPRPVGTAGAAVPVKLPGNGHVPSIGARFPAPKYPLLPGETPAKLRRSLVRDPPGVSPSTISQGSDGHEDNSKKYQ